MNDKFMLRLNEAIFKLKFFIEINPGSLKFKLLGDKMIRWKGEMAKTTWRMPETSENRMKS
jgi:hypothetical protein